jgi:methionyl-tRNA synthetase
MPQTLATIFNTAGYEQFLGQYGWLIIIALIWSLGWKGVTLWHAARNSQPKWFVALLLINTLGILEMIYYFGFRKPKNY